MNKRGDIVGNILLLSTFVMKGHSAQGQVFEDSLNVVLRPTRNTYMDIWEVKANKFFHKLEDLFSR